jgi:thioredoxin 1
VALCQEQPVLKDSSQQLADRIVKSEIPVLVDFWAPWCVPCHLITPILKDIKTEYAGRIEVMNINIDVHRRIAGYFRVTAIPAVFIVKDRVVVKRLAGVQNKEAYIAAVEQVLAAPAHEADSSDTSSSDGG